MTKYYVKALSYFDEYQLCTEHKVGYQQILLAEKLNNERLVKVHRHNKETIKLILKMITNFKTFMTVEQYTALTRKVMQTHMKKVEVIPTLRCLAGKYSEMGDH